MVLLYVIFQDGVPPLDALVNKGLWRTLVISSFFLWALPVLTAVVVAQPFFSVVSLALRESRVPWLMCVAIVAYPVFTVSTVVLACVFGGSGRESLVGCAEFGVPMSAFTFAFTCWLSIPAAIAMAYHLSSANKR